MQYIYIIFICIHIYVYIYICLLTVDEYAWEPFKKGQWFANHGWDHSESSICALLIFCVPRVLGSVSKP